MAACFRLSDSSVTVERAHVHYDAPNLTRCRRAAAPFPPPVLWLPRRQYDQRLPPRAAVPLPRGAAARRWAGQGRFVRGAERADVSARASCSPTTQRPSRGGVEASASALPVVMSCAAQPQCECVRRRPGGGARLVSARLLLLGRPSRAASPCAPRSTRRALVSCSTRARSSITTAQPVAACISSPAASCSSARFDRRAQPRCTSRRRRPSRRLERGPTTCSPRACQPR